jgi:histidine decarboxylase
MSDVHAELRELEQTLSRISGMSFGMPLNQLKPELSALGLSGLARYTLNNLGDPYDEGSYQLHSKKYERELIAWLAGLYKLQEDHWGYVTGGGSEGNLFGTYLGREYLASRQAAHGAPSEPQPESRPLMLFSADAHYSFPKAARMLAIDREVVAAQQSGEMNYEDLTRLVARHRARPLLLALSIGTTLKGAIDDVERVLAILRKHEVERFYIHCDAALLGMMLPFMDAPLPMHFGQAIGSISISGHKFLGSPLPCGIVLTRKSQLRVLSQTVEVTGSKDLTIGGSRAGFSALLLWYLVKQRQAAFKDEVSTCMRNAAYLHERLTQRDWYSIRHPLSTTVTLRRPADKALCKLYQLSLQGDMARVVVLPHISREDIDGFLKALAATTPVPP